MPKTVSSDSIRRPETRSQREGRQSAAWNGLVGAVVVADLVVFLYWGRSLALVLAGVALAGWLSRGRSGLFASVANSLVRPVLGVLTVAAAALVLLNGFGRGVDPRVVTGTEDRLAWARVTFEHWTGLSMTAQLILGTVLVLLTLVLPELRLGGRGRRVLAVRTNVHLLLVLLTAVVVYSQPVLQRANELEHERLEARYRAALKSERESQGPQAQAQAKKVAVHAVTHVIANLSLSEQTRFAHVAEQLRRAEPNGRNRSSAARNLVTVAEQKSTVKPALAELTVTSPRPLFDAAVGPVPTTPRQLAAEEQLVREAEERAARDATARAEGTAKFVTDASATLGSRLLDGLPEPVRILADAVIEQLSKRIEPAITRRLLALHSRRASTALHVVPSTLVVSDLLLLRGENVRAKLRQWNLLRDASKVNAGSIEQLVERAREADRVGGPVAALRPEQRPKSSLDTVIELLRSEAHDARAP